MSSQLCVYAVKQRPVQVLQGLNQQRLAVQVLAARHHCDILATLVLCRGTHMT